MQHALPVCVVHRLTDLARVVERLLELDHAVRGDQLFEGLALDVFHHNEEHTFLFFCGEDLDDVDVFELGVQPRFLKLFAEIQILSVGDLEGKLLLNIRITR